MKISVANPSVAPYVKQVVLAYEQAGMLDKFYTSFYTHGSNKLSQALIKYLPQLEREWRRRSFEELPHRYFQGRPWPELLRSVSARKMSPQTTDRIWEWAETGFDRWVAAQLTKNISAVHCYEHASLETLKKARMLGITSVYEQPSQHHSFFTRIAEEQLRLYPELKSGQNLLLLDEKAQRRNRRRDEELATADIVYCNSSFTRRTLVEAGIREDRIKVLPYGFPKVVDVLPEKKNDKVIFLNAGSQNLRKAMHLLYEAWRRCNFAEHEAELWLIGKMVLPESSRSNMPGKVVIKESIPHSELMELYHKTDVFVLPTLADGFGMVISEAMSRGVPVITTENSGGPDIITHGVDGMIIPAGSIEAIEKQMRWCVENKEQLPEMGRRAWQTAATWQWSDYRSKLPSHLFPDKF